MSISERARARRQKRDPDFTVRARNGRGWMQVGVAWVRDRGEEGLSIKLNCIPVNFDGILKVLPPYEPDDDQPQESDQRPDPRDTPLQG